MGLRSSRSRCLTLRGRSGRRSTSVHAGQMTAREMIERVLPELQSRPRADAASALTTALGVLLEVSCFACADLRSAT